MKIVMIHGQNHLGSTYHIGKILSEQLGSSDQIKEFFLPRDLNHFCLGCYSCIDDEKKCPFYEEKKIIGDAMEEADVLILTTPNYCMAPTASMKAFIDLFFQYWIIHRPRKSMFTKKAVVISTTAGMGTGQAIKTVKRALAYWGVPYIKTYGKALQASSWQEVSQKNKDRIHKDMTKLAHQIKKDKCGKPSLYIRFMFFIMARSRKQGDGVTIPSETIYWKENGWLDKQRPWR
ncbi:MAG: flavodoxin family protein [Faecalibacillus sp.]